MSFGKKRTDVSGKDEGHEYQQAGDWVPVTELKQHFGADGKSTGGVVIVTQPDPNTTVYTVLDHTAAVLVGRMAALDWAKLGHKKPVLCCECRNFQHIPALDTATCAQVRVEFVHSGYGSFASCREVNPRGECVMFTPQPPNPTGRPEMWEPAKPNPWWKFW